MNNPLTLKEALDAYQTQNSATDKLWAYFSAVTLAVLGYVLSEKAAIKMEQAWIIAGGYAVFCVSNHLALTAAHRLLLQLAQLASQSAQTVGAALAVKPLKLNTVRLGHASMALAVGVGVLVFTKLHQG